MSPYFHSEGAGPDSYFAVHGRLHYLLRDGLVHLRTLTRQPRAGPPGHTLRVLGYHRVCDRWDPLGISSKSFKDQMETLARAGLCVVSLTDAIAELTAGPLSRDLAAITFDDGYLDFFDAAVPILAGLGLPATVFVASGIADGRCAYHWYPPPRPPAMTWKVLQKAIATGYVEVGAHTITHPKLPSLSRPAACVEIEGSKAELEDHLGVSVTSFCYPGGLYGRREVELAKQAGYTGAVTTDPGANVFGDETLVLRRTMITSRSQRVFRRALVGVHDDPLLAKRVSRRVARLRDGSGRYSCRGGGAR